MAAHGAPPLPLALAIEGRSAAAAGGATVHESRVSMGVDGRGGSGRCWRESGPLRPVEGRTSVSPPVGGRAGPAVGGLWAAVVVGGLRRGGVRPHHRADASQPPPMPRVDRALGRPNPV